MDERTKRQIAKAASDSPLIWATSYLVLPKNEKWDFTGRQWQIPLFDDPSPRIVVEKPTQVGLTTIFIVRMLHFLRYHPARGMYTFPRRDDVTDFVNSRLEVLIENSPAIRKVMRGTDNTRLKQIGQSFLHIMEASVAPRMLDVDKLINDEIDLSNPEMLVQYPSRLDASKWKIHHKLSTPTVSGYGIDAAYALTDQKQWMVKCPGCNHWQILKWTDNLRVKEETDEAWYSCTACDRVLAPWDIEAGGWIKQNSEYGGIESGYKISQMMMPRMHPPSELWDMYKRTPIKTFYNLRLGETYKTPGGSLTRDMILERCFPNPETNPRDEFDFQIAAAKSGAYYMGYDQGNDLYAVVGVRDGDVFKIVRAEIFPFEERGGWGRLGGLFEAFKPRMMMGDATPNVHSARDLSESLPRGRAMIGFEGGAVARWTINSENNSVSINQTEMLDLVRDMVLSGSIQFPGSRDAIHPIIATVIDHLTGMERDEGTRKTQLGDQIFAVWRKTGADHFFHALGHMLIAHEIRPTGILQFNIVGPAAKLAEDLDAKKDKVWRGLR